MDGDFRCAIIQQAKLQMMLPFIFAGAIFAVGLALTLLSGPLGIPRRVAGGLSSLLFVGAIAFGVTFAFLDQGTIRAEGSRLFVRPRFRSDREFSLRDATVRLARWQSKATRFGKHLGPWIDRGALLLVAEDHQEVSIAAADADLAAEVAEVPSERRVVPPDYIVAAEDFRRLADAFGLEWPRGEGGETR